MSVSEMEPREVSEELALVMERLDATERRVDQLESANREMSAAVGTMIYVTGALPRVSPNSSLARMYNSWKAEETERERLRAIRRAQEAVERMQRGIG